MVVVGLGNPGPKYAGSRHNVGFDIIDRLAEMLGIAVNDRRRYATIGVGEADGVKVALAKPRTFMNNSGQAACYLLARFHVRPANMLIVYDEINLPLGTIRLRPKGSAAGHRGMESIIGGIGSQAFPRLRVGVGQPPDRGRQIEYVLAPFDADEQEAVREVIHRSACAARSWASDGIDAAMNRYNAAPETAPSPEQPDDPPTPPLLD